MKIQFWVKYPFNTLFKNTQKLGSNQHIHTLWFLFFGGEGGLPGLLPSDAVSGWNHCWHYECVLPLLHPGAWQCCQSIFVSSWLIHVSLRAKAGRGDEGRGWGEGWVSRSRAKVKEQSEEVVEWDHRGEGGNRQSSKCTILTVKGYARFPSLSYFFIEPHSRLTLPSFRAVLSIKKEALYVNTLYFKGKNVPNDILQTSELRSTAVTGSLAITAETGLKKNKTLQHLPHNTEPPSVELALRPPQF